jgi:hypothetical protein
VCIFTVLHSDVLGVAGMPVDPFLPRPITRVTIAWRNELKVLWVYAEALDGVWPSSKSASAIGRDDRGEYGRAKRRDL